MRVEKRGLLVAAMVCVFTSAAFGQAKMLEPESLSGNGIWIDPAFRSSSNQQVTAIVWFEDQLLGNGTSFTDRQSEFAGQKRSDMQRDVIYTLKTLSNQSYSRAESEIKKLKDEQVLSDVRRHWIVNGFSAVIDEKDVEKLKSIPGVKKIFRGNANQIPPLSNPEAGPTHVIPEARSDTFDPSSYEYFWNLEKLGAPKVWAELGVTGKKVMNVVHDFGFKLDVPGLSENLYVNSREIPGNGKDDDGNGYIDDYHGYNFDIGSNKINHPNINARNIIHGNACAAIISGFTFRDSNTMIGVAPESIWSPVMGTRRIEEAVEWAIEQGADTYSMSFSIPNLGELRSHWRKVMEHGTYAGVFFVSGAGNFANPQSRGYAAVPHQMRIPEGIPGAVFGIAGLSEDLTRPGFSSQGPVQWDTEHYNEGLINKPDMVTFNNGFRSMDTEGRINLNFVGGNSFAGPHLAGVLALMISADPELLPWEAMDILTRTANDVLDEGFDYQTGYGLVDAYAAVKEVLNNK